MSDNESNNDLQKQEIEIIESMYPEIIKLEGNLNSFILGVSLEDENISQKQNFEIQIEIVFPKNYPLNTNANYKLSSLNIAPKDLNTLSLILEKQSDENKGQSIVLIWINSIKEFLLEIINSYKLEKTNLQICNSEKTDIGLKEILDAELNLTESKYFEDNDYDYNNYTYDENEFKNMPVHTFENDNAINDLVMPPIFHGEFVHDRRSVFQGHLSPITDQRQVNMVVKKLKENKKIDEATHNIISYRIDGHNGYFISGCFDNGEIHAGSRMLHLMNLVDARDVLVVVTRWYGGIHLGADRYKHINNITRDLLDQYGYIKEKSNKKKVSSKKNNSAKLKR